MSASLAPTLSEQEDLLGIAAEERARLGRMMQFAEPDTWEIPSAAAGWWNRDVVAHLGALDTAIAQLFAGEPAEEIEAYRATLPAGTEPEIDGFNAWSVARRSGLDVREVIDTWGRAADAAIAYAAQLTPGAWRDARYPWFAGEIAPRFLVQSQVIEWFLHGEDMRATNGVSIDWQQRWQHWPVYLTIDMAIRMLPWQLAHRGLVLTGASLLVEAEGAGEGRWHWGLSPDEVPSPRAAPTAVIKAQAPQLALVVGRRLDANQALDAGTVVLGGDIALADTVLRAAKAYV